MLHLSSDLLLTAVVRAASADAPSSAQPLPVKTNNASRKRRGFTLVELILAIVIIGVLAAVALPRYGDLQNKARTAKLQGALGSINSAGKLFKAQCLTTGGSCATLTMEGAVITGVNFYPTADADGIFAAAGLRTEDFQLRGGGNSAGNTVTISVQSPSANSCELTYTAPALPNTAPIVTLVNQACD